MYIVIIFLILHITIFYHFKIPKTEQEQIEDKYYVMKDSWRTIPYQQGQIRYYVSPNDSDKVPILLIHGFNVYVEYYVTFINYAEELLNLKIYAPDHIGHGKTAFEESNEYSPENLMKAMKAVIDHENLKHFNIIGHSMGGELSLLIGTNPEWQQYQIDQIISLTPSGIKIHQPTGQNLLRSSCIQSMLPYNFAYNQGIKTAYKRSYNKFSPEIRAKMIELDKKYQENIDLEKQAKKLYYLVTYFPFETAGNKFIELNNQIKDGRKLKVSVFEAEKDSWVNYKVSKKFFINNCKEFNIIDVPNTIHELIVVRPKWVCEQIGKILDN